MAICKQLIDQQYLDEVFYDLNSPSLLTRKSGKHVILSKPANTGYYQVQLLGKSFTVHSIIYALHFGAQSLIGKCIDHINNVRTDNHIENLQLVSPKENSRKQLKYSKNTSSKTGVCLKSEKRPYGTYQYWTTCYLDPETNKAVEKTFSIQKYGSDLAFQMASDYRDHIFNTILIPAGYSPLHGS